MAFSGLFGTVGAVIGLLVLLFIVMKIISYRRVVPTNSVNIVQSATRRVSYGGGPGAKNTYYAWPAWIPGIGVTVTRLPVNVFQLLLNDYEAYDVDRVPFRLDLAAFFRIDEPNMAAERVQSYQDLQSQLDIIVKGAARTILANAQINEILGNRAIFGDRFTEEVKKQLMEWGVTPVKNIELMDIRDAQGSQVIQNIMAKKKSGIEMESRVQVAQNIQKAQEAEIEAKRVVAVRQQEAEESVGVRTAQKSQVVGIQEQKAEQEIAAEAKTTAQKNMDVQQVNQVRSAEINREVVVVQADRDKQVMLVNAEAQKGKSITEANGTMEAQKLLAEGVRAQGEAEGAAQQAVLMAPVNTQIALAKEIGTNPGYQTYLVSVRAIEANQAVGIAQAGALEKANVKVIANSGSPADGLGSVRELFTSKGGLAVGAMLEGLKNTETGAAVVDAIVKPNGGTNGTARK